MKKLYFLAGICFTTFTASAGNVYVGAKGTDANGRGTSPNAPYKTIQYAHDNITPGDTIFVMPDTFMLTSPIVITQPVTITRYDNTGLAVLDARNWSTGTPYKHMLTISGTNNVTINRLNFENCIGIGSKAIYVHGNCNNITLNGCEIRNIGWKNGGDNTPPSDPANHNAHGIHIVGDGAQGIKNLIISLCKVAYCATGFSEGVALTGYIDSVDIVSNQIAGIPNIGLVVAGNYAPPQYVGNSNPAVNQVRNCRIRFNDVSSCFFNGVASAGIYIDGAFNCIVESNNLNGNGVGISVGAEQPQGAGAQPVGNILVRNNLVIRNAVAGMIIGSNHPSNVVVNTVVCNNTLFQNRTGNAVTPVDRNGGEIHLQNINGLQLQNNVLHALDTIHNVVALDGYKIQNFRSDYNLYYRDNNSMSYLINNNVLEFNGSTTAGGYYSLSPTGWYQQLRSLGMDSNSVFAAPGYGGLTRHGYDFMPYFNTPLYNSGNPDTNLIPAGHVDQRNQERVFRDTVDIGAWEFQVYTHINNDGSESALATLYPNPVSETGNLAITLKKPEHLTASVTDISGKTVYTSKPALYSKGKSVITIPLNNLPPGNFFIMLRNRQGELVWTGKLVHQ